MESSKDYKGKKKKATTITNAVRMQEEVLSNRMCDPHCHEASERQAIPSKEEKSLSLDFLTYKL